MALPQGFYPQSFPAQSFPVQSFPAQGFSPAPNAMASAYPVQPAFLQPLSDTFSPANYPPVYPAAGFMPTSGMPATSVGGNPVNAASGNASNAAELEALLKILSSAGGPAGTHEAGKLAQTTTADKPSGNSNQNSPTNGFPWGKVLFGVAGVALLAWGGWALLKDKSGEALAKVSDHVAAGMDTATQQLESIVLEIKTLLPEQTANISPEQITQKLQTEGFDVASMRKALQEKADGLRTKFDELSAQLSQLFKHLPEAATPENAPAN